MKYGHVTGTKRHRPNASAWYMEIEAMTLVTLEHTWPNTNAPTQEMSIAPTQAQGSMQQAHEPGTTHHA